MPISYLCAAATSFAPIPLARACFRHHRVLRDPARSGALQHRPDPERGHRAQPARSRTHDHPPRRRLGRARARERALGPDPGLGQGPLDRQQHDQRPCRGGERQAVLPRRVPLAPVHRAGARASTSGSARAGDPSSPTSSSARTASRWASPACGSAGTTARAARWSRPAPSSPARRTSSWPSSTTACR